MVDTSETQREEGVAGNHSYVNPSREASGVNLNIVPGEPKLHGPNQISQGEIGRRTGLSSSTVSRILNSRSGQGRLVNIQAIAKAIGCTLDEFVERYQCPQ